jgi:hypothetical protein
VGFYDRVFAAGYDWFQAIPERAGQAEMRGRTLADAHGSVVELGAGTGLNLRHYPTAVEEVVLTEPTGAMAQRLERQLARSVRPKAQYLVCRRFGGVSDGIRTRDRRDHNPELYQLSYAHQATAGPI